jgi:hypothetical protein
MRFLLDVERSPGNRIIHYLIDSERVIINLEGDRVELNEKNEIMNHKVMGCIENKLKNYIEEYSPKLEKGKLLVLRDAKGKLYITSDTYINYSPIN